MDTIEAIFSAFKGPSNLARLLKAPVQTVHSWKTKRAIPSWRRPAMLDLAIRGGVALPPDALAYLGAAVAPVAPDAASAVI